VLESKPIEPLKSLTLEVRLLDRAVGTKEEIKLEPLKINEELVVNVWTTRTIGTISSIKNNKIELQLKSPVVTLKNEKVAISRRIQGRWRLIGCGVVV